MKISEGIKMKGRRVEIPDCSRDDLPDFFLEMGYKVGVEVGVDRAYFTKVLAKSGLKIYGVDPWMDYGDYHHEGYPVPGSWQSLLEKRYNESMKTLAPYPNVTIIRKKSMDALADFEDESLDFVYIDGHHDLKYVVEDILEWSRKVKKGGTICGHDYVFTDSWRNLNKCHVPHAVHAYTNVYKIPNWYVLGTKVPREGEKRDKWRSWMWIKPYTEKELNPRA
jgi:hypothetical protein